MFFENKICVILPKKIKVKISITKRIDADMNHYDEIIKRLEEENSLLKKQLSQLEADKQMSGKNETHLTENESIFRSVVENSMDGIVLIGEDKVVKEWNRGFVDMLGISKTEAVGKNLWEVFDLIFALDTYSKEEIEDVRMRLNDAISHKQQTNIVRKIVNLKTRQERIIHTIYFPVYQGQTYTICIVCRDVTVIR